jgi:hypothetical protein
MEKAILDGQPQFPGKRLHDRATADFKAVAARRRDSFRAGNKGKLRASARTAIGFCRDPFSLGAQVLSPSLMRFVKSEEPTELVNT